MSEVYKIYKRVPVTKAEYLDQLQSRLAMYNKELLDIQIRADRRAAKARLTINKIEKEIAQVIAEENK